MANQDTEVINLNCSVTLDVTSIVLAINIEAININGSGVLDIASIVLAINAEAINITGSATLDEPTILLPTLVTNIDITGSSILDIQNILGNQNQDINFIGTATLSISSIVQLCYDIVIDFIAETLNINGCTMDEQDITRHKGDTYPLTIRVSKAGDTNIVGQSFTIYTKIDTEPVYITNGIIVDNINGMVEFPFSAEAVSVAGSGKYDIKVTDSIYTYTYVYGDITLIDNVAS